MNRPQRRNALSVDHLSDLLAAFLEAADASGIVLAGAGR
jgi:enoyl-CoA hydratase/carnithine racemase